MLGNKIQSKKKRSNIQELRKKQQRVDEDHNQFCLFNWI